MHTLLQALLGALVASAGINPDKFRWRWLVGAGIGILPDLDVLTYLVRPDLQADALRGTMTHSLAFAVVMSPLLGWLFSRAQPEKFSYWARMVFKVLAGHLLLDTCAIRGTAWLFPFFKFRVAWAILPDFEPVLAFLLLLGVAGVVVAPVRRQLPMAQVSLVLVTIWSLLAMANKFSAHARFENDYHRQGVSIFRHANFPTPGNTLLWTDIGQSYDYWYVAQASVQGKGKAIQFLEIPQTPDSLSAEDQALAALVSSDWTTFSRNDTLVLADLRYGPADTLLLPRHYFREYVRTRGEKNWTRGKIAVPLWPKPGTAFSRKVWGR